MPVSASDMGSRVVDPGARAAFPKEADIWESCSDMADVASVLTSRGSSGPSFLYIDGRVTTSNRTEQTAGGLGDRNGRTTRKKKN